MSRYDVVVVGGGINGVGVAQAAAAAGYRVLVLEKSALASGTSRRSSKLIHGGLRYLENAHFGLVRESLRERSVLLRLAPELVHLEPFYIPIYPGTRRRPWMLTLGLALYAALAGFRRAARFGRVPRGAWSDLDGLSTDALQTVFRYYDAQTDDDALVRAVMASARSLGAALLAPAELLRARRHAQGCELLYRQGADTRTLSCRVLVNAAGPWAPQVAGLVQPPVPKPDMALVQGTHIVLPGTLQRGIYYVESPRDGRAVFVMPHTAGGGILVGTTERPFHGHPDNVHASPAERRYLLNIARHYFPRFRTLADPDIVSTTAGLRVLPLSSSRLFHRSREVILRVDDARAPRVISIYGGKLTTYRATAAKVIARIAPSLPERKVVATTDRLPLTPA